MTKRMNKLSNGSQASGGVFSESNKVLSRNPAEGVIDGQYYEITVPDTLDLAERARLGINHFTSIIIEERDYEMPWTTIGGIMAFEHVSPMCCQAKALEAMAMERIMSGSQQNLEREAKMVDRMVAHLGDDGIYYMPWNRNMPHPKEDTTITYCNCHGQTRMMRAMIAWHQYTDDPAWKERVDKMVNGIDRVMAIHKDDYAYFPTHGWIEEDEYLRSCYVKERGWKDTVEPPDEKFGEEGSLFNHQGHTPGALANWYLLTGNEQALRLSGEWVRFLTQPKFWADWQGGEYPFVVGAEHAHWHGHMHGHLNTLRAILEYAIVINDARLKQFVRDGYEWARQKNLARIGMTADGQGCGCGRLIGLAVKLSYAGIGDYWEDVDMYIRNHGTEMQFTPEDIPFLGEDVYAKAKMGGFAYRPSKIDFIGCCSSHGNMGIFYAWDGALRYEDGVVRINLLVNRASPWMDLDSYLPYEGKVVLKNKKAKEALVRIPLWVDKKAVRCTVRGEEVRRVWFGGYLCFKGLRPKDVVTIEFPMVEKTEVWTLPKGWLGRKASQVHTCRFRGNTLVEITPPLPTIANKESGSPLYQGRPEKYKANKSLMKKVTRFVTPLVLKW